MTIVERVREIITAALDDDDFVLIDARVHGGSGRPQVRITLDHKSRGLTITDCVQWSRRFEDALDSDPDFPRTYSLDVTSPGTGIELEFDWQYQKNVGREIILKVHDDDSNDTKKLQKIRGTLQAVDETSVQLDGDRIIPRASIAHAKIALPW